MADRYFVGDVDSDWVDDGNWASTSGGAGGAGFPGSADIAYFDVNSPDCLINSNITTGDILLLVSFANTLTQGVGRTISAITFKQYGGTFVGDDANITITEETTESSVVISGGSSFTSTSGALTVRQGLTISSDSTFQHNNGVTNLIDASLNKNWDTGSAIFNDFTINMSAKEIFITGTIHVAGELYLDGMSYMTGNISLSGDYRNSDVTVIPRNTSSKVTFEGTNNQRLYSNTNTTYGIPTLTINKPSGVVTIEDELTVYGEIVIDCPDGVVTTGSKIITRNPFNMSFDLSAVTWNDVTFDHGIKTVDLVSDFNIGGEFFIGRTGPINNGTIKCSGNAISSDTNVGGTGTIEFVGTADQTIGQDGNISSEWPANIIVNKPSGIVRLTESCDFTEPGHDLTIVSGVFCTNGFDLDVADQLTITGPGVLQRVTGDTVTYGTLNGTITDVSVCSEPVVEAGSNGFFQFF